MKPEQIAQQLFLSLRRSVIKYDVATRLDILQALIDEIDREMGEIQEAGSSEDEHFSPNQKQDEDEDDN
jgi:hypothetical protein